MIDLITAVGLAFGVVFVAELGDKTQLLALGFGARHSLRTVAIGLAAGYGIAGAGAALVGGVLGAALPDRPIAIVGGLAFVTFGVITLADRDADHGEERVVSARTAITSIALTIAIAEMGDKTQLATAALAARSNPVATWLGATAGEVAAGMIGAVAGYRLGPRIPAGMLRVVSAVVFVGVGIAMLIAAA